MAKVWRYTVQRKYHSDIWVYIGVTWGEGRLIGLQGIYVGATLVATLVTIYGKNGYRCYYIWLQWPRLLLYMDILCNLCYMSRATWLP